MTDDDDDDGGSKGMVCDALRIYDDGWMDVWMDGPMVLE